MTARSAEPESREQLYGTIVQGASKADLANTLFEAAASFGFEHATLLMMPTKVCRQVASLVLESSLPQHFFKKFDNANPAHGCQHFNAVRSSILPVSWSEQQITRQYQLVNAAEPPVLAVYREFGLSAGVLFPVSSIDGTRHVIRFDGDRAGLSQEEINDLAMLGMRFFDAYDRARFPMRDNPCGLTERELDVVRWSATGKTSTEIGVIMSLSDHTINAYMNNALRKLDCVNRTQLVAKAIRMRVIN